MTAVCPLKVSAGYELQRPSPSSPEPVTQLNE